MSPLARNIARTHLLRLAVTASVTIGALAGCGDSVDVMGPSYRPTPVMPSAMRSELLATVDLDAGTMSFERPSAGGFNSTSGISAAVYGNQNVTVRLYNSPVVITAGPIAGKKQYSALVGVKNLLAYPIGDEQGGDTPADTIGIDVFMVQEPVVTATTSACAPACTVIMRNYHGVRAFTAPNQKFWHWNDRLGAAGTVTDTTQTRTPFTFEADTQVRSFSFSVVVNAPWPAPYEARYKVDYPGDSLPTAAGASRWRLLQTGNANTPTLSNGLTLDPKSGELGYYRLDSIAGTEDAYVEARAKWNGSALDNSTQAEPQVKIVDGTKMIALGLFPSSVGFVNSAGTLVGTRYNVTTTAFHTYQVRKYAADSAVYFVDGARGGKVVYASLPDSPYGTQSRVHFGATNAKKPTTSTWDYVTYEIGVATP